MKNNSLKYQLFFLVIALAVSISSLILTNDVFASGSEKALATCTSFQYTTSCKSACVLSDPNGCGTAQWSYMCNYYQQLVYSNGKKIGSYISTGTTCSVSPNCVQSCN